jgi:hypothetical protein
VSKPEIQNRELAEAMDAVDFVRVDKAYRLIDQAAIQVLVPYAPYGALFEELLQQQDEDGISSKWMRRAQGLAVSILRPGWGKPPGGC